LFRGLSTAVQHKETASNSYLLPLREKVARCLSIEPDEGFTPHPEKRGTSEMRGVQAHE
jgi:hypothetical protein